MQKRFCRGKTGERREDGRCSECGGANFSYGHGGEVSEDGERGYRCVTCETIKPESPRAWYDARGNLRFEDPLEAIGASLEKLGYNRDHDSTQDGARVMMFSFGDD